MAYSDFSLRKVKKEFNLQEHRHDFLENIQPLESSDWLQKTLAVGLELVTSNASEKAQSEFIVVPILFELRQRNQQTIAIYSGIMLDVDEPRGLNDECDFILAKGEVLHDLQAPIFTIVEAKRNDIGGGLGQSVAQMIGARLFNQQENSPLEVIFGTVTTGTEWQFLKLEGNTIFIEKRTHSIENLGIILGILQNITDSYNQTV